MRSRLYLAISTLLAIILSFLACTSPKKEEQLSGYDAVGAFYRGNLRGLKERVDSTSAELLEKSLPGDTLIFENKYRLTNLPVKNPSDEGPMVICVARETQGKSDTITVTVHSSENDYKAGIDEKTLRDWLKFEPKLCTQIGKYFLEQRQDKKIAVQWLLQASMLGEPEAKYRLGLLYEYNMDFSEAIRLFQEAYDHGYNAALTELAGAYAMSGNREKAIRILKREAAKNNTDAMVALGQYYDTPSPPADATPTSSYNWYKKAAENGNLTGMYSLALHFEGESYYDSAFSWYSRAASLGDNLSMQRLADFYIEGIFVKKDFDKGWQWLQQAAKINKPLAYLEMGDIFRYGKGVRIDKAKALEYYKEAAANGLRVAAMNVEELEKESAR